jgi:hypothetical protein
MASGIIVGGQVYPVAIEGIPVLVFNWLDDGLLEFKPGDGHNKKRSSPIDTAAWHWTGGEGSPDVMAKTLRRRKLGVEFAIGARFDKTNYAAIYQFCDPMEVDTADTGYLNQRSVGIEMVNYAFKSWKKPSTWAIPRKAKDRNIVRAELRGRDRYFADFYPHQYGSALALADVLSEALDIPRMVPMEQGDVLRRTWTKAEMNAWLDDNGGGHVGHYMVSDKKADPGPHFMHRMGDHFGQQYAAIV